MGKKSYEFDKPKAGETLREYMIRHNAHPECGENRPKMQPGDVTDITAKVLKRGYILDINAPVNVAEIHERVDTELRTMGWYPFELKAVQDSLGLDAEKAHVVLRGKIVAIMKERNANPRNAVSHYGLYVSEKIRHEVYVEDMMEKLGCSREEVPPDPWEGY